MSDMLTAVTGPGGTGVEAAIDGYLVAGKTGTAQKADYVLGGYADDAWTSSFVGFVPASHPRLVIAVVIDEPVIEHYGGLVAGPVFRRVGTAALRHLGVPADGSGDMLARRVEAARAEHVNSDRTVAAVAPVVAVEERAPAPGEVRVPDLGGQVARRALVTLARAELLVDIEGSGIVVSQSPSAGDVVARGSTVRIVLSPPTFHNDEPPPQTNEDDRTVAQADVIP